MKQLSANTAWFQFVVSGGPEFGVYAFNGREAASEPYEFAIELVSLSSDIDLPDLIGREACLTMADKSGEARPVHGLIREMRQLHTGNQYTHYQCLLVPRLWFLGLTSDHRIFQQKSVVDIVSHILQGQRFTAESFAFKCFGTYPPREYCVQYGESDLHFLSRLCEEEGIYYYFEHTKAGHCLCFSDMPGGPPIAGEADLRFFPGSGQAADGPVLSRLALRRQTVSNKATCREWDFTKPAVKLEASEDEPDAAEAPAAPGIDYDVYRYLHGYRTLDEGQRYARIQLLRQLTFAATLEGGGDVARLLPGFTFSVHDHERDEINAEWWVTGVRHTGEQPQVLGREAPDRGLRYHAAVTAIPARTRYVPPAVHPKQRVTGAQTALVTGPKGEEIHTDEYGRVKVRFFWDRQGTPDEHATCWLRVSQGWAGSEYGALALPRIGHEVVVTFLEGDPDRPVITGRLYHAGNMPPYELPAHKTRTVFKSMSTPARPDVPGGFNELRVEDKADAEEIYVHAQKDVNLHVNNDWKDHIVRDRRLTVDAHTYARTGGETHETLHGQRKTEIFADTGLAVHADGHAKVDGKWLDQAGLEIHCKAGSKIVLEADTELTVKAGGSWLKLNPAGVHMAGATVNLAGGGAPGKGTRSTPASPAQALLPGAGTRPRAVLPSRHAGSGVDNSEMGAALAHAIKGLLGLLYEDDCSLTLEERCQFIKLILEDEKLAKSFSEIVEKTSTQDVEYQGWVVESGPGEYQLSGVHSGERYSVSIGKKPANAVVEFHTHVPGVGTHISSQDAYAAASDETKPVFYMVIGCMDEKFNSADTVVYDGNGEEIDCEKIWDAQELEGAQTYPDYDVYRR